MATDAEAAQIPDSAQPPVKKREIFGWAMYDFANSSYTTVVISVIYSAFFTGHIIPADSELRDTYWTIAIVASTLLALILSPFVGAVCDYSGGKKRYLALSTVVCALSTMALFFVGPGDFYLAIVLIMISNAAFMIGESFCGSFLTDLANKKNMAMISGLGWGLGYFGGLMSLVLVMGLITATPEENMADFIQQNQIAMIAIGIFFALSAVPTFALVRERSTPAPGFENASFGKLMAAGLKEFADSYKLARRYKTLFKFFIAFMIYMAGLEIIIKFVGIYANQELAMTQKELTVVFLVIQVSAALGALAFGFLEARIGPKPTVMATIAWWIIGSLAIFFLPNIAEITGQKPVHIFYAISLIAGGGIGSIQSSSRTVVGLLSPASRSAQMFGFWGTFSRLAIILGLVVFGPMSDMLGRRYAILSVAAFFAIGGLVLLFVPIEEGIKEAEAADKEDAEAAKNGAAA